MTTRAKCKTDGNTKNDIPGAEVAAEDAVICMRVCDAGAGAHVRVHYRYKL